MAIFLSWGKKVKITERIELLRRSKLKLTYCNERMYGAVLITLQFMIWLMID